MSVHTPVSDLPCPSTDGCARIDVVIQPADRDLGGFFVRRALPSMARRMIGPWVFFDHFGPAEFAAGTGINVRPHPHINIATVTYLFEGEILHRDSVGSEALIHPGDINLMIAGHGIVHSERERPEVAAVPHRLHGLQLWLALPAADEEMDPAFIHYPADAVPVVEVEGVPVRVMMGSAYGVTSPVRTFAETLYLEALLQPGQTLTLPAASERAIYVAQGAVQAGETPIAAHELGVCAADATVALTATEASRVAVIGGESLGRRYIEWNYVSSRKERVAQAKADWQAGRFPKVPGDDTEFIPYP